MKRIVACLLLVLFLSGCESMYYDMVMDKSEVGKSDKDEIGGKGSDVGHLSKYH